MLMASLCVASLLAARLALVAGASLAVTLASLCVASLLAARLALVAGASLAPG
jgi:hypothetical protein